MNPLGQQLAALRPALLQIARQRLCNDAWADDAVSETLLAAIEKPPALGPRSTLHSQLLGILQRKLAEQMRRDRYEAHARFDDDRSLVEGPLRWGDPEQQLMQHQFFARLARCLRELPPQQCRAFVLHTANGLDTDEICGELGVTANHLSVLLHRARARLRNSMLRHGLMPAML